MRQSRTPSIGLEVHPDAMAVASVAREHAAEVLYLGTRGTRPCDRDHLVGQRPSTAPPRVCVSDAGPCGSWLSRYLMHTGHGCWVAAPSVIPPQAGGRVKTDRRDAGQLARLRRAGDLPPGSVPQVEDEAVRALTRAREEATGELTTATWRLKAVLLRHDRRDPGRATWGPAPLRGLAAVVCPTPAPPLVFQEDGRAVTDHTERRQRLARALPAPGHTWRRPPVVEALQALRGGQFPVAVTLGAARGALTRFDTPRHLTHDLGLSPAACARGARRRQGALTTAGTPHARRVRVEGAWAYRPPAQVSRHRPRRLAQRPKPSQDRSWKAPARPCTRVRRLMARGKHAHQGVVALARARGGCLGALATHVPGTPSGHQTAPVARALEKARKVNRQRRSPGVGQPATACRDRQAHSCLD